MKPVAVIIVGADMLLSARPASPIQLWHACLAAGYDLVVPATWGDELIAAECLRVLGSHPLPVAVMCSCPKVAQALSQLPADVSPHLVSVVAPPVATAKYLRRVYGDRRVHITYAGACPAAADSALDAWIAPAELLERFRMNAILLEAQPELFESILPPDRRRHLSVPGGLPAAEPVMTMAQPRPVQELNEADLGGALARHLASGVRSLVDLAPRAGCACSGAVPSIPAGEGRAAVAELEPPRSVRPLMADPGGLGLSRRLPVRPPTASPPPRPEPAPSPRPRASERPSPPERDRPATAGHAPTRSPLSWHLRERAHPQPPTTARPESGAPPRTVRTTGASSAAWAKPAADRPPGSQERPDAITSAAVRALEDAASRAAAAADAAGARAASPPMPAAIPGDVVSRAAAEAAAIPPARVEAIEERSSPPREARAARATPPGGYWFAAPVSAGALDAEVHRPSVPLAAVPDDVAAPAEPSEPAEASRPTEPAEPDALTEATASTSAAPGVELEAAVEEPGAASAQTDSQQGEDGSGRASGHVAVQPGTSDADAPEPKRADDSTMAMSPAPIIEEPPSDELTQPEQESVGAELAELFRRNEGELREEVVVPPSTPPAAHAREAMRPGPLPWRWMFGATLVAFGAIALTRRLNERVQNEDAGTSALVGGAGVPQPLPPTGRATSEAADSPGREWTESGPRPTAPVPTVASGVPARGAPGQRRAPGAPPASTTQRRVTDSITGAPGAPILSRAAVRADSAPPVTPAVGAEATAPVASLPPAAAAGTPPSARDLELQSIRDEIARRSARLDSMGRAINSLYVAPRTPPPPGPPRPAPPPPTPGPHP